MRILFCGFRPRAEPPSTLRFRSRRCRRRQIASVDFVGKPHDLVGTVAEGLVGGVAATAKRDFRPAGEPEGFSSGINDLEVTFDPQRTVVRGSDFRCGHGCLLQEFSDAAPSNKPLRYVGTRLNSTRVSGIRNDIWACASWRGQFRALSRETEKVLNQTESKQAVESEGEENAK